MPVVYSEQSEGQKLTFHVGIVVDILNCVQAVSDVHCTVCIYCYQAVVSAVVLVLLY